VYSALHAWETGLFGAAVGATTGVFVGVGLILSRTHRVLSIIVSVIPILAGLAQLAYLYFLADSKEGLSLMVHMFSVMLVSWIAAVIPIGLIRQRTPKAQ